MATSDSIDARLRLLIVNWALVGISAVFLALHLFVRINIQRRLAWDDYVLFFSWIFVLVGTGVTVLSVGKGLGRHRQQVTDADFGSLSLLLCISSIFYSLAIAWSKTSFALRLLKVVPGLVKLVLWSAIIIINAVYTFAAVLGFVRCSPSNRAWDTSIPGSCWDISSVTMFSIVSAGVSATITFALVISPWIMIPKLQLIALERVGLTICMSLGVIAGAIAIRRSVVEPSMWTPDGTYDAADVSIWLTAEIATTIVAISLPNLRLLSKSRSPQQNRRPLTLGTEMTSVITFANPAPASASTSAAALASLDNSSSNNNNSRRQTATSNPINKAYNKKYSQHSDFDGTFKSKVFAHTTTITSSASQRRAKREAAAAAKKGGLSRSGEGGGSLRRTTSKASSSSLKKKDSSASKKKKKQDNDKSGSLPPRKSSTGTAGTAEVYYDVHNSSSSSPTRFSFQQQQGEGGIYERRDSDVRSSMATFRAILAAAGQRVTQSRLDHVVAVQSTVTVTHDDNSSRGGDSRAATSRQRSYSNATGASNSGSPTTPTTTGGGRWFGNGSRRGSEQHDDVGKENKDKKKEEE